MRASSPNDIQYTSNWRKSFAKNALSCGMYSLGSKMTQSTAASSPSTVVLGHLRPVWCVLHFLCIVQAPRRVVTSNSFVFRSLLESSLRTSRSIKGSFRTSRSMKGSLGTFRSMKGSLGTFRSIKGSLRTSRSIKGSLGTSRSIGPICNLDWNVLIVCNLDRVHNTAHYHDIMTNYFTFQRQHKLHPHIVQYRGLY